jgi:hypothetical protein
MKSFAGKWRTTSAEGVFLFVLVLVLVLVLEFPG